MTTQEIKTYINRILGDNVRCLLPSYWWKRAFSVVLDSIEQIVPIVDSKEKLEKLDVPKGSIATVANDLHSFSECFLINSLNDDVDISQMTTIPSIVVTARDVTNEALIWFESYKSSQCFINLNAAENKIEAIIANSNLSNEVYYTLMENGELVQSDIDAFNRALSNKEFIFVLTVGEGETIDSTINSTVTLSYIDKYIKWSSGTSAYIKGAEWEELAKKADIPTINIPTTTQNTIPLIDVSDNTMEIEPNKFYRWSNPMGALTITLATPTDDTILNSYMFEFVSGASGCVLGLPSLVEWADGVTLTIKANTTYQVSIVNNNAVYAEF